MAFKNISNALHHIKDDLVKDEDSKVIDNDDLDKYTKIVLPNIINAASTFNDEDFDTLPIPIPTTEPSVLPTDTVLGGLLTVPREDENFVIDDFSNKLGQVLFAFTSKELLFPVIDDDREIEDVQAAIAWRDQKCGAVLPEPQVLWDNVYSDESCSMLAFGGMPVGYTSLFDPAKVPQVVQIDKSLQEKIVYQNDMLFMNKYRTRKPLFDLGAVLYFDAEFQIVAMYAADPTVNRLVVDKDEKHWETIKRIWCSSWSTCVTIKDHLVGTHLNESGALAAALMQNLGKDHPIRRLLTPFTFRTLYVNWNASFSLLPEGGLVHRTYGLEYQSLAGFVAEEHAKYKFVPYLERYDQAVAEKVNDDAIFPYHSDMPPFFEIMHEFVREYVDVYYADVSDIRQDHQLLGFWRELIDALQTSKGHQGLTMDSKADFVSLVTNLVCIVTSLHEWVGAVNDLLYSPDGIIVKQFRSGTQRSLQSYTEHMSLTIATTLQAPLLRLSRFTHLVLPHQGEEEKYNKLLKVYLNADGKLIALEKQIEERNKNRRKPLHICCVSGMLSAVSI